MSRPINDDRRKEVRRLYDQGLKQCEIADKLGVSQSTVAYYLNDWSVGKKQKTWMDVKDGLPKHPHPVLVTVERYGTNWTIGEHQHILYLAIGRYSNDKWYIDDPHGNVIGWRDLPETYRRKKGAAVYGRKTGPVRKTDDDIDW